MPLLSRQRCLAGCLTSVIALVVLVSYTRTAPQGSVDAVHPTAPSGDGDGDSEGGPLPVGSSVDVGTDASSPRGLADDPGHVVPPDYRSWTAWRALYDYCKYPTPCVKAATTDPRRTVFVGLSKYGPRNPVRVGDRIVFGIRARDADGMNRACGGDSFRVEIRGPSMYVGHPIDNLDGTYSFAARLFDEGVYSVHARLDYRECEGLYWCQRKKLTILIEWIGVDGEEAPQIVVTGRGEDEAAHLSPPLPPDVSQLRGGLCPGENVYYRRWMPLDDPALRMGRWRPRNEACADPSFPGTWRCKAASHRPAEAFVWHPIVSSRPTMDDLLRRLRNVWIHSVGDSLNRNLYHYMLNYATTLPEFGTAEISCYRMRMPGLSNVTDAFVVESSLECVPGRFSNTLPSYVEFLKVAHFPRVNVTLSYHHASELTDRTEYVPQRDGFKMWTSEAFLKQLQGAQWPESAGEGAGSVRNETLPAPHVKPSRAFAYPFVPDDSVAPTHVLFNIGLHYVSTVPDLDKFPALMRQFIDSMLAAFPASRTRLIWRSTAQTQYDNRTLPAVYLCRTFQRVMLVNEVSAEMVADAGIPVLDYLQYSFGRADASPDNRHYTAGVQYEVASELLNHMLDCPSPAQAPRVDTDVGESADRR